MATRSAPLDRASATASIQRRSMVAANVDPFKALQTLINDGGALEQFDIASAKLACDVVASKEVRSCSRETVRPAAVRNQQRQTL